MSSRFKHILITVFSVFLAIVITFQITYLVLFDRVKKEREELSLLRDEIALAQEEAEEVPLSDRIVDKLNEINTIYTGSYIHDIDEDFLLDCICDAYVYGTGDKYSAYYTPEDYADFALSMSGGMVGIGISVLFDNLTGIMEITSVMPDSPALEGGLLPGDILYSVEGDLVSTLGYYKTLDNMKGEEGTKVNFTILRKNAGEESYDEIPFTMERRMVTVPSVTGHLYDDDKTIGIIEITEFDTETPRQFTATLNELIGQGATRFVFDIRDNPGGELNSILNVLDVILPAGPLVRIVDREGNEQVINGTDGEIEEKFVVLVNGNTASAAELFSSAVKDYRKGILVGTNTYGKGTMQHIYTLSDGSAIKVSDNLYNPPYSDNYEGIGVKPDFTVEMAEELQNVNRLRIDERDDTQLQAAISILNVMAKGIDPLAS